MWVILEACFLSPRKEELVLRFASFSTLLPLGLKMVVLTALPESGFGHHHTILFKIIHLFCDLVVFCFLSICSLVPVSIKKTGTNNSSVLNSCWSGIIMSVRHSSTCLFLDIKCLFIVEILHWRAPLEEKGRSSKRFPNLHAYGLCWKFVCQSEKGAPSLSSTCL